MRSLCRLCRWKVNTFIAYLRRPLHDVSIHARTEAESRRAAHRWAEQLAGRPLSATAARRLLRVHMKAHGVPRAPQASKKPLPPVPAGPSKLREAW